MNDRQPAWPPQIGRLTLHTIVDRLRDQRTTRLQYRVPGNRDCYYRVLATLYHDRARGIFRNETCLLSNQPEHQSGHLVITHQLASDADISRFLTKIFDTSGFFACWCDPKLTPAGWVEQVGQESGLDLDEKDRIRQLYAVYMREKAR